MPIGGGRSVGFARNVGFDQRLRRKDRRHQKLTLHTRQLVTGNAAEIDEVSGFRRAENDRRARALAVHPRRFRVLIGKYDVMFGALAIDQGELHDLSFGRGQNGICLAVDRTANTQKDHFSFGDSGAQGVLRVREIGGSLPDLACGAAVAEAAGAAAFAAAGATGRGSGSCQECDHVFAVMIGLEAGKRHSVAGHDLLGIHQIAVERGRIPRQCCLLHGRRIIEIGFGGRLAADDPGQAWTQDGLSRLQRMTRLTFLEDLTPGDGVALRALAASAFCGSLSGFAEP